MGADLGTEAVLERGDDASAVGVVLGVGRRHDEQVEVEPQHVATDLDIALLHHVEHGDLDALGEVGQLVDRDDAAVGARDETEVDRVGVAQATTLGHLHRVDVTDEVGDRRVRRGQLLGIALAAVAPRDRQVVTELLGPAQRRRSDRLEGVLAELGALDDRGPLVEQPDQGAQQSGLALTPLAEQDHVVAGDEGALELWDHRRLEAVQARPRITPLGQCGQQVGAQLGAQGAELMSGGAQGADSRGCGAFGGDHETHASPVVTTGAS